MKLLQRFRKNSSGEAIQAEAAQELEAAVSSALAGKPEGMAEPIDLGAASDGHDHGVEADADVAPVADLTARRRATPKKATVTKKAAATKPAARKATTRKAAAPATTKKPRATTAAARKPSARTTGTRQSTARKRQG